MNQSLSNHAQLIMSSYNGLDKLYEAKAALEAYGVAIPDEVKKTFKITQRIGGGPIDPKALTFEELLHAIDTIIVNEEEFLDECEEPDGPMPSLPCGGCGHPNCGYCA